MKTALDKELLISIIANPTANVSELHSAINDIKDIILINTMNQALLRSKLETLEHDASYLDLLLTTLELKLQNQSSSTDDTTG